MLIAALCFFGVAFPLGVMILFTILKGKPTPKLVVLLHGGVALTGLGIVLAFVMRNAGPSPYMSLTFFGLAVVGGLTLFSREMQKKPIWIWLALLHPILAATGIVFLIAFMAGI